MNIYYAHFVPYQKLAKRVQKGDKRLQKDIPEIKKDRVGVKKGYIPGYITILDQYI